MALNLGSTAISTLRLGTATPSKVMLGATQVWPVAGGEPWTPADIASLSLFFDGSDALSMTVLADNKISEWRDKSSLARTVSNTDAGSQPTLVANGVEGGVLAKMNDSVEARTSIAHFAVVRVPSAILNPPTSGIAYYGTWPQGGDAPAGEAWKYDQLIAIYYSTAKILYQPSNNGVDASVYSDRGTANRTELIAGYWDASTGTPELQLWRDSVLSVETIDSGFPLTSYAGRRSLAIGGYLDISINREWGLPAGVPVHCVITCSAEDMRANRLKLEGWGAHTFGLTANLPADHPYKNAPPTK